MAEYIKREAALQIIDYAKQLTNEQIVRESGAYELLSDTGKACYDGIITALAMCKRLINEAVIAADVQPIRHGRWITKAEDYYKAWQDSGRSWDDMPYFVTGKHIACSECFTEYDVCTEGIEHWTGCPCCLTRMDGDTD